MAGLALVVGLVACGGGIRTTKAEDRGVHWRRAAHHAAGAERGQDLAAGPADAATQRGVGALRWRLRRRHVHRLQFRFRFGVRGVPRRGFELEAVLARHGVRLFRSWPSQPPSRPDRLWPADPSPSVATSTTTTKWTRATSAPPVTTTPPPSPPCTTTAGKQPRWLARQPVRGHDVPGDRLGGHAGATFQIHREERDRRLPGEQRQLDRAGDRFVAGVRRVEHPGEHRLADRLLSYPAAGDPLRRHEPRDSSHSSIG
jgi:hypothetical protein